MNVLNEVKICPNNFANSAVGPSIYRICSDTTQIHTDTTISLAMTKKPRQKYKY